MSGGPWILSANRTGYAVCMMERTSGCFYTVNSDYWDDIAGAGQICSIASPGD